MTDLYISKGGSQLIWKIICECRDGLNKTVELSLELWGEGLGKWCLSLNACQTLRPKFYRLEPSWAAKCSLKTPQLCGLQPTVANIASPVRNLISQTQVDRRDAHHCPLTATSPHTLPHTHAHTTYPQETRRGWAMWRIFSPHIKSDNSWVRGGYLKIVSENNPITLTSTMYPGKNGCRLQYKETHPFPFLLLESSALSKMEAKMLCEKHQPLQWDVVWHLESCLPLALWDS